MQKDIIYIDAEDDITTIIGKIKKSKGTLIALVPPKRVGPIHGAVNLRLIARAASQSKKRVVLVTSDQPLALLASSAGIPTAKNLQSKPELAKLDVLDVDDGSDVIDGSNLPDNRIDTKKAEDDEKAEGQEDDPLAEKPKEVKVEREKQPEKETPKKIEPKVPNFSKFRKKFILIGAGVLSLIVFAVWAIWFAPSATIVIKAKTEKAEVMSKLRLVKGSTNGMTDAVQAMDTQEKKTYSVDFDGSGSKNVGEKARGMVTITNEKTSSITLTTDAVLKSSSGNSYRLTKSITVPAGTVSCTTIFSCSPSTGKVTGVTIEAVNPGASYNGASGTMTISGLSNIGVKITSETSGGTDKKVKIVTSSDINSAKESLKKKMSDDSDQIKSRLLSSFDSSKYIVINESFSESTGDMSSQPALDGELSDGVKAKMTTEVTRTVWAVSKDNLGEYLGKKLLPNDNNSRKVYDNGVSSVVFSDFAGGDNKTVSVSATGQVGPSIDEKLIKEQSKNKHYGEIQSSLESIQGVQDVDVKFWPFWVSKAPNSVDKIKIEYSVDGK